VEVIVEQAVAVELERLPLLQLGECDKEGRKIGPLAKHVLAVVATIDHVVNEAIINRSQGARHDRKSN